MDLLRRFVLHVLGRARLKTGHRAVFSKKNHMETIDDQLRRADEKRVKLLAQEMLNDWIRTVYDNCLRTTFRIAGEIVVAVGLIELFRS
jgi:hypothetical protein